MAYQAQCEPSAIKQSITINSFSESIKIVKKRPGIEPMNTFELVNSTTSK